MTSCQTWAYGMEIDHIYNGVISRHHADNLSVGPVMPWKKIFIR